MSIPQCSHFKLEPLLTYSTVDSHTHTSYHHAKCYSPFIYILFYNAIRKHARMHTHTWQVNIPPHPMLHALYLYCGHVLKFCQSEPTVIFTHPCIWIHFTIASQVNGLYSKASTPYAIQLYFTPAMALENKNAVPFTYEVHTHSCKVSVTYATIVCYFFITGRQTHSDL